MVNLTAALSHLKPIKVLVLGDFFLDEYTSGEVSRISPEAPVPIMLVSETRSLPGGAGNVALNLEALGATVTVLGRVGDDIAGNRLRELFSEGLLVEKGYKTGIKNRFIASGHQLMRADYEKVEIATELTEKSVHEYLQLHLHHFDIISISDYGKGFLTNSILESVFTFARKFGKKVIVDPKGKNFLRYNGAFLIKPNLKEAYAAALLDTSIPLQKVGEELLSVLDIEHLLITRSERGMSLFSEGGHRQDFPAERKNVIDVTGAGDTALAMLTFALGNNLSLSESIEFANIASSISIQELGCVAVKISEIAKQLLEKDPVYKIFYDGSESFIFEKVVQNEGVILLKMSEDEKISAELVTTIREISERKGKSRLIVHVPQYEKQENLIHFLASLREVNLILAAKEDNHSFLSKLSVTEEIQVGEFAFQGKGAF